LIPYLAEAEKTIPSTDPAVEVITSSKWLTTKSWKTETVQRSCPQNSLFFT